MTVRENLFGQIPNDPAQEEFRELLRTSTFRLERIVSLGQATPTGEWLDQVRHEWVVLLSGAAQLRFETGPVIDLRPGDYLHIPAHRRHRVEWTDPTEPSIWLALHYDDR